MFCISMKSSSLHKINCDVGGNCLKPILWLLCNSITNMIPYTNQEKNLKINQFVCDIESSWPLTEIKSSPSRKLSDLFWINFPWDEVRAELGAINIIDIGCGTGTYGKKIQKWSHGQMDSYSGIDVTPRDTWKKYNEEFGFHFIESSAENFLQYIPDDANFFMSQSVLEHIEEDLSFFEALSDYLRENKKQALQIHLVPSEQCINLYKYHGVRQYSVRTLGKICKLFSDYSRCSVYTLGGESCNRLHHEFISNPLTCGLGDLREEKTTDYELLCKQAIMTDFVNSEKTKANFYALVIHSYP